MMEIETASCPPQAKAKLRLAVAAGTFIAVATAVCCSDITLKWLAAASFVAGVVNIVPAVSLDPRDAQRCTGMTCVDGCKIKKVSATLQNLDFLRCALAAVAATVVPVGLFFLNLAYDHSGREKAEDAIAQRLAVLEVLDGENVGKGPRKIPNRAVLRKWGDEIDLTRTARIITRKEPAAVGSPGQATVELEKGAKSFLGASNRLDFQLVREQDGGVTYYYMRPVQDVLSFGNGTIRHQQYVPLYFGKRGEQLGLR